MARLSRAESQAHTRRQLLDTARALFLRRGYAATSLDEVAEAAGYSKGAVYSNFRNKDQLCLAVLDAIHAERSAELAEVLGSAGELEHRLQRLQSWAERVLGDPAWTALEVEFAANARHDPELLQELRSRSEAIRSGLTTLLEEFVADNDLLLPVPADRAATALFSLGIGLGAQRSVDPQLPARALTDTIRLMLRPADEHRRTLP